MNNGLKRLEVTAFVRTCWTKTETMKGSNKRKSFVEPVGMNGSNFKNRHKYVSLKCVTRSVQVLALYIHVANVVRFSLYI